VRAASLFVGIVIVIFGEMVSHPLAQDVVPVLPPGLHTRTLERGNGSRIGYAISVPATYAPDVHVPLVLALHFGVQGGPSMNAGREVLRLLIGPGLIDLNAIIVAPDVIDGGPWSTETNEQAVLLLLDQVMRSYSVDPKKVLVTGFSMGGSGAWHFAGKYPDRFTAAVPIAGRPPAMAESWRVPVFALHSRRDQVVPFAGTEQRIDELKRAGVTAELLLLESPTHYQTAAHAVGLRQLVPLIRQIWK